MSIYIYVVIGRICHFIQKTFTFEDSSVFEES